VTRDKDWVLSLVALAGALGSGVLLISEPAARPLNLDGRPIAEVTFSSSSLRRRPAQTLVWEDLARGASVNDADILFVPPGGEARIRFTDGSVLELDESSLVVLAAPEAQRPSAQLKQGSVSAQAGGGGLLIESAGGQTTLQGEAEGRVEVSPAGAQVQVFKGSATVAAAGGKQTLGANQGGGFSASGQWNEQVPAPAALESPARNQRLFFREAQPGPLSFQWKGAREGLSLQLARDRLFGFVTTQTPVSGNGHTVAQPGPGLHWWRLVDERGVPVSEARRFTLIADVPPEPVAPRANSVLWATESRAGAFRWTEIPNVRHYRVEIASTRDFAHLSLHLDAEGSPLWVRPQLAEGYYWWRVRADEPERGESAFSEPVPFRLIHRPIPEAPELIDSEVEVDGP
jgi:hypothetical protein